MRHAFLIIAHNNFEILKYQIEILDNENTAFYIHIDKRAKFDCNELRSHIKKSKITFLKSKKIRWGHFSQVDCELRLIRIAALGHFDYYHLISGVDMPLHTVKEMDVILGQRSLIEYIHFDSPKVSQMDYDRIRFYHFFPGRKDWERKINGVGIKLQKLLRINRLRGKDIVVQKGANWFSITDNLVQQIVQDESKLRKMLKWSFCGDEIFLQTYVYNSEFRAKLSSQNFDNDYSMCLRKIDWNRGNPYVYRECDLEELLQSDALFARKFDCKVDMRVVEKIYKAKKMFRVNS